MACFLVFLFRIFKISPFFIFEKLCGNWSKSEISWKFYTISKWAQIKWASQYGQQTYLFVGAIKLSRPFICIKHLLLIMWKEKWMGHWSLLPPFAYFHTNLSPIQTKSLFPIDHFSNYSSVGVGDNFFIYKIDYLALWDSSYSSIGYFYFIKFLDVLRVIFLID
jgi:hypothetical protein